MVVLFIPLAIAMDAWFGYRGIFGAAAICNIVLGVLSFGWVRSMLKKEIARHGPQVGAVP
jgi:predicted MFS family arabinose efflux permease